MESSFDVPIGSLMHHTKGAHKLECTGGWGQGRWRGRRVGGKQNEKPRKEQSGFGATMEIEQLGQLGEQAPGVRIDLQCATAQGTMSVCSDAKRASHQY